MTTLSTNPGFVNWMQHVPRAFPAAAFASAHFTPGDVDDLILGSESIGRTVVDVQITRTVASLGDDVGFPGLVDDAITVCTGSVGELSNEFVVRRGYPCLGQRCDQ
ncbi:hypothetical protein [Mycolicibacterium llatzerense]|uniref:hypothetical protein n=1 Tax=Mycolicibacterium llatzerense TaxID=280871 RepID=UPI0012FF4BD2|nr:hypothetical protein [Mycolicibacterium llatzerense]